MERKALTPEQRQLFGRTLERLAYNAVLEHGTDKWPHIQNMLMYVGTGMLIAWRVDVGPNTILTDAIEEVRNKVKLVGHIGHA